jgi:hypothetical protein
MSATPRRLIALLGLALALLLGGCGSKPITIADLPTYPDAIELRPGESTIGDTLQQNMQQDAAMREAMGAGGSTEQKGFSLPAGTSWEAVKGFYGEQLKAEGWAEGVGGPGGNMASQMMEQANVGNELFQTALFSKDRQVLSVIRVASPTDPDTVELVLSLSTR